MTRMRPPRPPRPPRMRVEGWQHRLRFELLGRRLLARSLQALSGAPADLDGAARAELQRRTAVALFEHLQVELKIEGLPNLPRAGRSHLVIALHEGMADGLALSLLGLPLRFVARDEVLGWPTIGPALTRMRHIGVTPEHGASAYRQLLREAAAVRASGEHLGMFPQGTVLGIETEFRAGAFRLAHALSLPILPVVITGTHRIWEHPFAPTLRYRQVVGVRVLPAIGAADVAAAAPEAMRAHCQRLMKQAALAGDLPAPRRFVPVRDGWWDGFSFAIDPAFMPLREALRRRRALRHETLDLEADGLIASLAKQ